MPISNRERDARKAPGKRFAIPTETAEKIRRLKATTDMTMKALADRFGVTQAAISRVLSEQ